LIVYMQRVTGSIFNIAHSYLTAFKKDEKGKVVLFDREHVDEVVCEATSKEIELIKAQILNTDDWTKRESLFMRLISISPKTHAAVEVRSQDIKTIINNLKNIKYDIKKK